MSNYKPVSSFEREEPLSFPYPLSFYEINDIVSYTPKATEAQGGPGWTKGIKDMIVVKPYSEKDKSVILQGFTKSTKPGNLGAPIATDEKVTVTDPNLIRFLTYNTASLKKNKYNKNRYNLLRDQGILLEGSRGGKRSSTGKSRKQQKSRKASRRRNLTRRRR